MWVPSTPDDRYFDYCLQPYTPQGPTGGKWRSESLLWLALQTAGAARVEAAVRAVQAHCRPDMTVYGVKHDRGRIFFELYFYDPRKEDPRVTQTEVKRALERVLPIEPVVDERIPYFMWSFDLDAGTERVDAVHLYLAAREVQAGRSYTLRGGSAELVNHYRFLHPKLEIEEILHGIKSSVFVDFSRTALSQILLPQLFSCNRICVAKKRGADGIYFSGLDVGQLGFFLERFDYPSSIRSAVEAERDRLDHLRFDVGIDYRTLPDGTLETTKTSFYGSL